MQAVSIVDGEKRSLKKRDLFKVKKVISISDCVDQDFKKGESEIGILIPCFNKSGNVFEDNYCDLITLDSRQITLYKDEFRIQDIEIEDEKIQLKVDKIIGSLKSIYEFQKDKYKCCKDYLEGKNKLYEEFIEGDNKIDGYISEYEKSMNKEFDDMKKINGFMLIKDVINYLNDSLNLKFKEHISDFNGDVYTHNLDNQSSLNFVCKDSVVQKIAIKRNVDVGPLYNPRNYDFIVESHNYESVHDIVNLRKSDDFKKLKSVYFKKYNNKTLKDKGVYQEFDASLRKWTGNLIISQSLVCELNMECTSKNMKLITSKLELLLNLCK